MDKQLEELLGAIGRSSARQVPQRALPVSLEVQSKGSMHPSTGLAEQPQGSASVVPLPGPVSAQPRTKSEVELNDVVRRTAPEGLSKPDGEAKRPVGGRPTDADARGTSANKVEELTALLGSSTGANPPAAPLKMNPYQTGPAVVNSRASTARANEEELMILLNSNSAADAPKPNTQRSVDASQSTSIRITAANGQGGNSHAGKPRIPLQPGMVLAGQPQAKQSRPSPPPAQQVRPGHAGQPVVQKKSTSAVTSFVKFVYWQLKTWSTPQAKLEQLVVEYKRCVEAGMNGNQIASRIKELARSLAPPGKETWNPFEAFTQYVKPKVQRSELPSSSSAAPQAPPSPKVETATAPPPIPVKPMPPAQPVKVESKPLVTQSPPPAIVPQVEAPKRPVEEETVVQPTPPKKPKVPRKEKAKTASQSEKPSIPTPAAPPQESTSPPEKPKPSPGRPPKEPTEKSNEPSKAPTPTKRAASEKHNKNTNIDDITNDVGIDIEEEEEILAQDVETEKHKYIKTTETDADALLLSSSIVKRKLSAICKRHRLDEAALDCVDFLSLSVHDRLVGILEGLVCIARARLDLRRKSWPSSHIEDVGPNVRKKLMELKRDEERALDALEMQREEARKAEGEKDKSPVEDAAKKSAADKAAAEQKKKNAEVNAVNTTLQNTLNSMFKPKRKKPKSIGDIGRPAGSHGSNPKANLTRGENSSSVTPMSGISKPETSSAPAVEKIPIVLTDCLTFLERERQSSKSSMLHRWYVRLDG
mmetsp:Transcript_10340/g.20839  ORF Transcript_10340/g.20839 Transcript_10340/m.20839 type:complete len:760 (-) Transcript_10340:995-3274(-)|eukprot:CAMPEP_0184680482 /NCGR_PEP_ID=MMETSP0312-20130426/3357_1 /TAXON_ID=31354 /ORGANISM="Compsopogon coeruleus, Strain SAG 36.94" /LENGTH=759 /DNA_ID=CAMNT_0027130609 /DNA_START=807 /DNA_END=3086 /DNA_ORIENTATION=+